MGSLKKTLLIISGGKEALEGIKIAKQMGLTIIICDGDKNAPGRKLSDVFIHADIYDSKKTINALKKYSDKDKIDGVITIATDAVKTVAAVADFLKLPGINKKTAILTTDKFLMKKCFKKNKIPIPKFYKIKNKKELQKNIKKIKSGVLKPTDSRGARGVIRVDKNSDLNWAFNYSRKFSNNKNLILEEWIEGDQISTESLVIKNKTYLCGVADRNYSRSNEMYPFIVEDGGETPSKNSPRINHELTKILDKAVNALGIKNGIIKGDIVLKNGKPLIIETAARLSGGFFSTITIPNVYKINIVKKAILLSLGMDVESPPKILKHYNFQANRFLFPKPGIVKKIKKISKKDLPKYVKFFEVNVKKNDIIKRIENHPQRKGSVLVIGKSRKEVITRSKKIIKGLKIEFK